VADLGKLDYLGGAQVFISPDYFVGAKVYPTSNYGERYMRKHTLLPVCPTLVVRGDDVQKVKEVLNVGDICRGHSFSAGFFKDSKLGLNDVGLAFNFEGDENVGVEFQNLYTDIAVYHETLLFFRSVETLSRPETMILHYEMSLLTDLSGMRADPFYKERDVGGFLEHRLDEYIGAESQLAGEGAERFKLAVRNLVCQLGVSERISQVGRVFWELEDLIGDALLTPILFSLGSSREDVGEGRLNVVLPLKSLVSWQEHISRGNISLDEVREILVEKGYSPVVSKNTI